MYLEETEESLDNATIYDLEPEGNPKEELKELLAYMEDSREDNVKNETLKRIHQMIKRVKSDEEVSLEYMKIYERERMLKEQGHTEGSHEEAKKNVRNLFKNGADFDLVKKSITTLTEKEVQDLYNEVNG